MTFFDRTIGAGATRSEIELSVAGAVVGAVMAGVLARRNPLWANRCRSRAESRRCGGHLRPRRAGADGVHSGTREQIFGPQPNFQHHLSYQVAIHPIADSFGLGAVRAHYTEPGRQLVLYPTDTSGQLIAMYLFHSDITTRVDPPRRAPLLRAVYDGIRWHTPAVLEQIPESIFVDTLTQICMPRWHHGRVVLVGDACGCTTLASAHGVSMAMAGGYLLAESLRTHPVDHKAAFATYQARLQPQVSHRQRNARRFARGLVPRTQYGLTAQKMVMRVVMRAGFTGLLRKQFGANTILPLTETRARL